MLTSESIKEIVGDITIVKTYPKSGQKQVFKIDHNQYGTVILKIVEGDNERVKREIKIITENSLDNVPKVLQMQNYDLNGDKGIYIIEEYIDGETLREILVKGKLNLKDAICLTDSLLRILVQLESIHVVHRDIKPENIIRDSNNNWYLIDFGIARVLNFESLTLTNYQVGPHTPGYGAPELFQYSKRDIDGRADLFSIGVVVFESLTGEHPFIKGDEIDINEIWYKTKTITPKNIVIEGDVDMQFMGLIQTFMQKHITRRPRNAAKALEWFDSVIDIVGDREE